MIWLTPADRLTPEQGAAVRAPATTPLILRGGPGAGKTVVLLHRAKALRDLPGGGAPVRVLVYTNVLRDFIRSAVAELRLEPDSVLTFDHWCRLRHEELIGPPPAKPDGLPDFVLIRQAVLGHLRRHPGAPALGAALIDEGQDLDADCYELLRLSARHLTVAFDSKQAIYRDADATSMLRCVGPNPVEISLESTYRACPYVVDLACEFIADPVERERFRSQSATPQIERQTPLLYRAADEADERRRLVEILRERLHKNERVGILFPTFRQVGEFADFLQAEGILADRQTATDKQGRRPALDFSTGRPAVLTYHSAKGLTFDSVLMPALSPHAVRSAQATATRMLFVALTRATQWVYVSATENRTHPEMLAAMLKLQGRRTALVQTRQDLPRTPRHRTPTRSDDWRDL